MLTGHGLEKIDVGTRQALEQILELFTKVGEQHPANPRSSL
jgi:hypothetical protein